MPEENRIWFPGNPWPEGHPIKDFAWTAEVRKGIVWFFLHLKTADYYSERDIDDEGEDFDSSWEAPIVWGNYHSCTISSTDWHDGGFPVCPCSEYSIESLDGYEAIVDPLPINPDGDWDDLAFHTYLLGHDSVAGHKIKFSRRNDSNDFDIHWEGKIALVYAGDYEYRYDFKALVYGVGAPKPTKAQQDVDPNA
ncbi:hypothetical protein ACFQY0_20890 [Haloferula chungangensis]|uniref:Uncharacterized protein n=1 Tax=Haloferula chungangensis TaxID=1048331 RepID=A0ABW2LCW3_9BACT